MTSTTVSVSSELPVPARTVADLVAKPALLRHVIWPLITFPDLPERYDLERGVTVAVRLFGVVPLWDHTIRVVHGVDGRPRCARVSLAALGGVDRDAHVAVTEEHGGPIRMWRHRLTAVDVGPDRCRYTDEVEIDAGSFTRLAGLAARVLYAHRHRRWAALASVLAA